MNTDMKSQQQICNYKAIKFENTNPTLKENNSPPSRNPWNNTHTQHKEFDNICDIEEITKM